MNPTRVRRRSRRTAPPASSKDPRAGKASFHRYYYAPSYVTATKGDAEALDPRRDRRLRLDSRLYRKLVMERRLASSTGGWYSGSGLDSGKVSIYAVAADGVGLGKVEDRGRRGHRRSARAVSRGRAGARQEQLSGRLHLRERQPVDARPPLRLGPRRRPHRRRYRGLARGDRQGDGGRRQGRRGQVPRPARLGDRHHDPDRAQRRCRARRAPGREDPFLAPTQVI